MSRRGWLIAGGAVLILVALGVGGFFHLFEKVEEERREPPAGEARTNRFLALERFMSADGWQVETVLTQSSPVTTDTLAIIAGDTSNYGPDQIAEWQTWIEAGGHLVITEPPRSLRRQNDMLHTFGFADPPEEVDTLADALSEEAEKATDEKGNNEDTADEKSDGKDEKDETPADSSEKSELSEAASKAANKASEEEIPMWGEPAETREGTVVMNAVADCPNTNIEATTEVVDRVWLGKGDCMIAVSRAMGEGRITLVPNIEMFQNTRIGKFQHPRVAHDIFWQTSGKMGQDARISLYGKRVSWIEYLWGLFWPTCLALLLVLLFALLGGLRRFGPMVAPIETARRRRTEHVVAIGRFMWKHGGGDTLLASAQEALIHAVARGRAPSKMKRSEKANWLAERTGITVEEARRIMAEHAPATPQHFADLIKQIEDLRRR